MFLVGRGAADRHRFPILSGAPESHRRHRRTRHVNCAKSPQSPAIARPDPPLAQRIPLALASPALGGTLGFLAICALLRLLSWYLQSSISVEWLPDLRVTGDSGRVFAVVLGLLLDLAVVMMVLKLAVEAMLDAAHDRKPPPGQSWHVATDRHATGQIFLLIVMFLPAYLLALWEQPGFAWAWLLCAFAAWPAAAMLEAMEENFLHALNPLAWLALVGRLGGNYLLVVATNALLVATVIGIEWAVLQHLPGILEAALARILQLYALLAAFRLAGELMLQRREALGLEISMPIVKPQLANAEEDEVMHRAQWLLDRNEPGQAIDCLQELIRRRGASAPVHACYRQLLTQANDVPRLGEHARLYVGNLLAMGQDKMALALAGEALRTDPAFRLEDADDITRLVAHAAATGQSQMAVDLAAGFDIRFPKSPDIARNELTRARLLAERFGRDDEARRILTALAARYPDHPLAPEVALALGAMTGPAAK